METKILYTGVSYPTGKAIEKLVYKEYGIEVIARYQPIRGTSTYDIVVANIDDKQFAAIATFIAGVVAGIREVLFSVI